MFVSAMMLWPRMNLRTPNFPLVLDNSTNDVQREFFVPALRASQRYDRGVGYFSSGWPLTTFAYRLWRAWTRT